MNVALLPGGDDPDTFIRKRGGAAYVEATERRRGRTWSICSTARQRMHDLEADESRRRF